MTALFDLFGFLSVVTRGVDLASQSVLAGSVAFAWLLSPLVDARETAFHAGVRRTILIAAGATAAMASLGVLVEATLLRASLGASWREVAGATFVGAGAVKCGAAAIIALLVVLRIPLPRALPALSILAAATIAASVAGSHAAARLHDAPLLLAATAMHMTGAALWLGGLPCLRLALRGAGPTPVQERVGRRYSRVAAAGVALIVAGATVFAARYIGSVAALIGTAYGVMTMAKTVLVGMLLALGASNFRSVRCFDRNALRRVRCFVDAEMMIGAATFLVAASMTSAPPATDVAERVTWREIAERLAPTTPRLSSPDHDALALTVLQARIDRARRSDASGAVPQAYAFGEGAAPPRNAYDVAWSEYNHHWAGLLVVTMGLAAFVQKRWRAEWARHWPLLFLGLAAFLFLRADPEVWPLGDVGFFASLRDPEVAQHRVFVLLIVAFAMFEWRVRTGRSASRRLALVFPVITAIGAALLSAHSHGLADVKDQLLVEFSHMPIAVLGLAAGAARWVEVAGPGDEARRAGWIWPACFALIGLLLLDYHEA